jgi:integrase
MQLIDEFLESLRHSKKTKLDKKRRFINAVNFFSNKGYDDFFSIPPDIFYAYFEKIDDLDIVYETKNRYRTVLKDYYKFLIRVERKLRKLSTDYDYDEMFSKNYFKFKDFIRQKDVPFIEISEVFRVLEWAKYSKSPNFYFLTALLATTGGRFGYDNNQGISHLTRNQIDFHTRTLHYISKGKENISFISRNLVEPLQAYVRYLPPSQDRIFSISGQKYNQTLQKFSDTLHSHLFRDALNTHYSDTNISESIRAIMLNQKPSHVNSRHYLKKYKNWNHRRIKYDQIDPFRDYVF